MTELALRISSEHSGSVAAFYGRNGRVCHCGVWRHTVLYSMLFISYLAESLWRSGRP